MKQHKTHKATSARSLKFTKPVFPSVARDVLDHPVSFVELQRIAAALALRKGLDGQDIGQDAAVRILRSNQMIRDFSHWTRYCAIVVKNCCADEWRKRFRRSGLKTPLSLSEQNAVGGLPHEGQAALEAYKAKIAYKKESVKIDVQGKALERMLKQSTRLPASAYRVLKLMVEHAGSEETYMKNGRLNGSALSEKSDISQSTISRQIRVIRAAAAEIVQEMFGCEIDLP